MLIRVLTCSLLAAIAFLASCNRDESPGAPAEETASPSPPNAEAISDTRPNAATEYARIRESLGKDAMDPLVDFSWRETPDADEARYLASLQGEIAQIIAASKIEHCDTGIDSAKDLKGKPSPLSDIRVCFQLLHFDASRCIASATGADDAADRVAAMLRVTKHAGSAPTLINKLIGASCASIASQAVVHWSDKIQSLPDREKLRVELQGLIDSTVFDVRAVLDQELHEIRESIQAGEIPASLMREGGSIAPSDRAKVLADVERIFALALRVWDEADGERQIRRATDALQDTQADVFVSWISTAHRTLAQSRRDVESAMAALQKR